MEAILIVGHGSRSNDAKKEFEKIIEIVNKKSGKIVKGAHMELAEPNIPTAIKEIVSKDENISLIKIVPYFLFSGIHIKEDIPEIIEELKIEYPNIDFKMGTAFGAEEMIGDLLIRKINEMI